MDANTLFYLIVVPILLFSEALLLIALTNRVKEESLKLFPALYVVLISGICMSGIAKFLAPYTGLYWGFLVSLVIIFLFIYGYLTEKVHLSGKSSAWIAGIYLAIDVVAKFMLFSFAALMRSL
jgi:hypothetical protein